MANLIYSLTVDINLEITSEFQFCKLVYVRAMCVRACTPPGSVKWGPTSIERMAGRQKAWFISFADKRLGVQFKLRDPFKRVPYLSASGMRFSRRSAISSARTCTFTFTVCFNAYARIGPLVGVSPWALWTGGIRYRRLLFQYGIELQHAGNRVYGYNTVIIAWLD